MKKNLLIVPLLIVFSLILVSCNKYTIKPAKGSKVPYLDKQWVNVWYDEFNGNSLDLSKWNYELGGHGWGNNERQNYTNKNVEVSNGTLKINIKKEDPNTNNNRMYSSSRITTKGKGDFKYGRIQASIKLPLGRGLWPAFWMMPSTSEYGTWPRSGEIDIMEHVGYDPTKGHTTIHTNKRNGLNGTQVGFSYPLDGVGEKFHLYELVWLPNVMISYVDGVEVGRFTYTPAFNQDSLYYESFPFDQNFFLILNVAVGGNWGGQQGIDDNIFPATMEVDFVRVYELDAKAFDKEKPEAPKNIKYMNQLPNSLFWDASKDDSAVAGYEIYVNDVLYQTTTLHNVFIDPNNFNVGSDLIIKIRAFDLSGKFSDFSQDYQYKVR